MIQGSPEWFAARIGKVTASRVSAVVAKSSNGKGYGVSRSNYMADLIAERLTGESVVQYVSPAMDRGKQVEEEAREAYSFLYEPVEQVGFIPHPRLDRSGASPDGRVGMSGLVQFKCPNTATHIDTLLGASSIPKAYRDQMTWEMVCDEREWCDFVSFDPRMPANMRLCRIRFDLDLEYAIDLEVEVRKFLSELDAKLAELMAKFGMEGRP